MSAADDERAVESVAELGDCLCKHCKIAAGCLSGSQRAAKQSGDVLDGEVGGLECGDRSEDCGEAVALVVAPEPFALDGEGLAGRRGGDEIDLAAQRSPVGICDLEVDGYAGVTFGEDVAAVGVALAKADEAEAPELEGGEGEARPDAGAEVELAEKSFISSGGC
nr:hypothetical protein [Rubidibacter lacunae]